MPVACQLLSNGLPLAVYNSTMSGINNTCKKYSPKSTQLPPQNFLLPPKQMSKTGKLESSFPPKNITQNNTFYWCMLLPDNHTALTKKMESDQSITITKATHFQLLQQLKSIQRMSQMHSCPYKQQETRHYVRALEEKYH